MRNRAQTAVARGGTRNQNWVGLTVAVALGMLILVMPTPQGLSRPAQSMLAITSFTVVLWLSHAVNNGVASVLMMALMVLVGTRPQLALSGFSSPQFWILLSVLYYGFAMQRTGLAQRISYYILSLFPGTYPGILAAFFIIGWVLMLGIPSMTVRTAIIVPIAWALVQSLGIAGRSRGSALIMLTAIEMAVLPGSGLLYGSLNGPVVESMFQAKHLALNWLDYAEVMGFPTLLLCLLLLGANQLVLKPESPLRSSPAFAREKLRALGPIKRVELITAAVVAVSIAYWATDRVHHLPGFLVGMLGLGVFALAGVVRDEDIAGGVSWTLLLFLGGVFSLSNVISEYKITDWLAACLVPAASRVTFSSIVVVVAMAAAMFVTRFLDPTAFISVPVLFLSVSDVMTSAGIPPLVVTAPLLLASAPFWLTYQSIWVAMGEGMTSNQAFTGGHRVRLANVYAVAVLLTLMLAVVFWRLVGVL